VSGSRGTARWLALLASIPLAGAGCKREPKPLEPPDPAVEAVDLSWSDYRRDETASDPGFFRLLRTWEYCLTLSPGGRFRYAWRHVDDSPEPWKEIVGKWQPAGSGTAKHGAWTLEPDLGSASLEVGGFEEGELPKLVWATQFAMTSDFPLRIPKTGGMNVYLVPELDPVTAIDVGPLPAELRHLEEEHPELHRTLRRVKFLPDPRLGIKYPDAKVVVVREDD
jgi:hypothetical protein